VGKLSILAGGWNLRTVELIIVNEHGGACGSRSNLGGERAKSRSSIHSREAENRNPRGEDSRNQFQKLNKLGK